MGKGVSDTSLASARGIDAFLVWLYVRHDEANKTR